jgi:hypothetical protein
MAGRLALVIRLRFHNRAPQQLTRGLAFHQQAANQLGSDDLSRAAEEGLGEDWEVLGGRGGYGSGLEASGHIAKPVSIISIEPLTS